jgi:hydroxyacylglutathione hydrolase
MNIIQIYAHNTLRNFSYLFYHDPKKEVICVDPYHGDQVVDLAQQKDLSVTKLWNTHLHYDHTRGNKDVEKAFSLRAELPDAESIISLGGDWEVQVLFTPGHTREHVCFLISEAGKQRYLISGDTLFNFGVGNCKNGGDPVELYHSFQKILDSIDDDVVIYPGHDYYLNNINFALSIDSDNQQLIQLKQEREQMKLDQEFKLTNIQLEKQTNPFLRLEEETIVQGLLKQGYDREKLPNAQSRFLALRTLRDRW